MSDILHAVAALQRARDCPEIWREVAEGLVSPEQAARTQRGREPEARIAASVILFAPPEPAHAQALVDASMSDRVAGNVVAIAPAPRKRRAWLLPIAAAAAAAVLVLVLVPERDPEPAPATIALLGVEYDLELRGGFSAIRSGASETGEPLTLQPASEFELVARPEVALPPGAAPDLVVFAFPEGGRADAARSIDAQVERADGGTLAISGRAGALLNLDPGAWTLVVVVGPQGHLPTDASQIALGTTPQPHWQVIRRAIVVVPNR